MGEVVTTDRQSYTNTLIKGQYSLPFSGFRWCVRWVQRPIRWRILSLLAGRRWILAGRCARPRSVLIWGTVLPVTTRLSLVRSTYGYAIKQKAKVNKRTLRDALRVTKILMNEFGAHHVKVARLILHYILRTRLFFLQNTLFMLVLLFAGRTHE